jgi:hypothetical protein
MIDGSDPAKADAVVESAPQFVPEARELEFELIDTLGRVLKHSDPIIDGFRRELEESKKRLEASTHLMKWRDRFREGILGPAAELEHGAALRSVAMSVMCANGPLWPAIKPGDRPVLGYGLEQIGGWGEIDVLSQHPDGSVSVIEVKHAGARDVRAGIGQALCYAEQLRMAGRFVRFTALAWSWEIVEREGGVRNNMLRRTCESVGIRPMATMSLKIGAQVELEAIRMTRAAIVAEESRERPLAA